MRKLIRNKKELENEIATFSALKYKFRKAGSANVI